MSDLIERVEAACRYPVNTCGASRHAAQIGVALVRDEPYPMLDEEPAYCGESILSVVASLWEARTEIERLTAALQHEADCVEAAKAEIERLQIGIELFEAADADLRTKLDAESDLAGMIAAERDELRDVLLRRGFVPCHIPACNCGSWHHRYGLPERMQEIKDALAEAGHELSNANGNLPLNALKALVAERDELRRQLAEVGQDARRYRDWLRGGANIPPESTRWPRWEVRHWNGRHWNTLFAEQMDAAIDAQIEKEKANGSR